MTPRPQWPRRPAHAPESDDRGGAGPSGWSERIAPSAHAPGRARRSLERLTGILDPRRLEDAQLLVSELVTNSVQHGWLNEDSDHIDVEVRVHPDRVRVDVSDTGPGFDPVAAREPGRMEASGRGLWLLGELSDRHGFGEEGPCRVWFEMLREPRPPG